MRPILRAALALGLAILLVGAFLRFVTPGLLLGVALDFDRSTAGMVSRSVTLPDGVRIAYLEGGRGPALVLLHDFAADKDSYLPIARFLTPHYQLIVPDLAGFGDSAQPAGADYSPAAQAARLSAFCRAIGLAATHVGGSGMGAQVALAWAAAAPRDVQSLWLLAPTGLRAAPESELARTLRESGRNPLLVRSEDDLAALPAYLMSTPRASSLPDFLRDVQKRRRLSRSALDERIYAQVAAEAVEPAAAQVRRETFIVFGGRDRIVDARAAPLWRSLIAKSHAMVLAESGHSPAIEQPQRAASDYVRFRDSM
ncbi:MAG TPA: alpha/beta fold hydrolase [Caldimonas sp.]|nr:alpha/beta fold hydrolase [Caldimonas sp.]HEX2540313.1 alpha/beta fold hydrolase [Caldimonas sp.]